MRKKVTLERVQEIASQRNGKYSYNGEKVDSQGRGKFQCEFGHVWIASILSVIYMNSWCPACSNSRKKKTIDDMRQIANTRGGRCLSSEYINARTKLLWECKKGHRWSAKYSRRHWCPVCSKEHSKNTLRKYTLNDLNKIAKTRGGKCLRLVGKNSNKNRKITLAKTQVKCECIKGHQWITFAQRVIQNNWCPFCSRESNKTIKDMQQLAKERGGQCISNEYKNNKEYLRWECVNKHVWNAIPSSVMAGSWCPQCKNHTQEEKCRYVLEEITGKKFPKSRSILGNGLELDGFSKCLSLAFERQGEGHFSFIPFFHKNYEKFKEIQKRDKLKKKLCEEKGIGLITVPLEVQDNALLLFFIEKLKEIKIDYDSSSFKWKNLWISVNIITEAQKIAEKRNGECLSKIYVNGKVPLLWKCNKCKHRWDACIFDIRRGCWCPKCAKKVISLEDVKNFVSKKNGKCLSSIYNNSRTKLKIECEFGHVWFVPWYSIKQGRWCPYCYKSKRGILF